MHLNLFEQGLLVFAFMLLILGYFQYRRSHDVIAIVQEMFRWQYLGPAFIVAVVYMILKVILGALNGVI